MYKGPVRLLWTWNDLVGVSPAFSSDKKLILCVYVKSQASTGMFTAHYCVPPRCTDFTDMT